MPPAYLVRRPYGTWDDTMPVHDDPWGWPINEYEEALSLRPGLERLACHLVGQLQRLARGEPEHEISDHTLSGNPYWPARLAERAPSLKHERFVTLLPLALSRTKDDKGRTRWTLFGGSEQGPAKAFWRSFFTAPGQELPTDQALTQLRRLLSAAYDEPEARLGDLRGAGFRILPQGGQLPFPWWDEGPLPAWTCRFLWQESEDVKRVKYLLTFRAFARLPAVIQRAYLAEQLHLLPCPASLLFWGGRGYLKLARELPLALQVPLLMLTERYEGAEGVRVPQAGWTAEPLPDGSPPAGQRKKHRSTYRRTHRYMRIHRFEDPLVTARENRLAHVLFSTAPSELGLYDKPMARNVQIWDEDYHLLLDGPRATFPDIRQAADVLAEGGWFGYRFVFPAMRLGRHEVYWHRPLVSYLSPHHQQPVVLADAPAGYLTAYSADWPDPAQPVELWPRFLRRELHQANVRLFHQGSDPFPYQTLLNVRKLLSTREALGGRPLSAEFARSLLTLPRNWTLEGWLESLPKRASDPEAGRRLAEELRRSICSKVSAPSGGRKLPESDSGSLRPPLGALTFEQTARRSFEVAYWELLATLSAGEYLNKNNADPCLDRASRAVRPDARRDLDPLGEYLLAYHTRSVAEAGMTGKALVGQMSFPWQTEYPYPWMGGWLANHQGRAQERNLIVLIPGRDRRRAVLFADHYDTAYMEDVFERDRGGSGARIAAPGADDNCSATATLLLAAPIFLRLSQAGKLGCDVWLIHLTGEEFPAEGLGANYLCQRLVEDKLQIQLCDGQTKDLFGVRVVGLFVMDMIGHNSNKDRDVFQIAPGACPEAMELAHQAHLATESWNTWASLWNRRPARRGRGRGRRSRDGRTVPPLAEHLRLHGEVRPYYDPRSTLFNTDGQMFSDVGVPVVLFMENYDINRAGYHDTRDTLANINLDYAAALAAIAIESVARVANGGAAQWSWSL
jgi:hypothetical protein